MWPRDYGTLYLELVFPIWKDLEFWKLYSFFKYITIRASSKVNILILIGNGTAAGKGGGTAGSQGDGTAAGQGDGTASGQTDGMIKGK